MDESYKIIARMLRSKPETVFEYSQKLEKITGKSDVIKNIVSENDAMINKELTRIGFEGPRDYQDVYDALIQRIKDLDARLFQYFDRPNLMELSHICGKLCETAIKIVNPKKGFFIKKEKAIQLLDANPPVNLLEHFGVKTASELIDEHGFAPVFSSLRFTQSNEWMHDFFDKAYEGLTADDFEEREVEMIVLDTEWLKVAEKFMKKKYHNVSHLKELGVIFIVPIKLDIPGETLRMFTLLLHYLNEVPFYSKLIKQFAQEEGFVAKLQSLLRGDVLEDKLPQEDGNINIRIVQRYLAKDDENDFRLLEPHVNPEAEHWYKAEGDLEKLIPGNWQDMDFSGLVIGDKILSFDLIDLTMSLAKKGEIKYLYHQEEALWNKIFIEYFGRDEMNRLIDENIIRGYITI